MTWSVVAGVRNGPIALGAPRADVVTMLGSPTSSVDDESVDHFDGVVVRYDKGRVESVEVWPELGPVFDGRPILGVAYSTVVAMLRESDPHALVRADGVWSLATGIGVGAQTGVREPRSPGDSVVVFVPDRHDATSLFEPTPDLVVVREMTYQQLESTLSTLGWTAEVRDRTAPLVVGEPELVEFRQGDDVLTSAFQPVAGVRSLDVSSCSPAAAHMVLRRVRRWASVDVADVLVEPVDDTALYRALIVAHLIADPKLTDLVDRFVDHPRHVIAAAARACSL